MLRELINLISDMIYQTEMLLNRTENALSTDCEFGMQLRKATAVRRDEIVDNHPGDLGRPRCNVEKEELETIFDSYVPFLDKSCINTWCFRKNIETKKEEVWNDHIKPFWT